MHILVINRVGKRNHKTSTFAFHLQFSKLKISLLTFSFSIIFSTFAIRFSDSKIFFAFHLKLSTFHFFFKIFEVGYKTQNEIFELSMQCSREKEGKRDKKLLLLAFSFSIFFSFLFFHFSFSKIVSLFA